MDGVRAEDQVEIGSSHVYVAILNLRFFPGMNRRKRALSTEDIRQEWLTAFREMESDEDRSRKVSRQQGYQLPNGLYPSRGSSDYDYISGWHHDLDAS